MLKAVYRINGGEVIKLRDTDQTFAALVATGLWGVLTDPTTPDGVSAREDIGGGRLGPLRQLGFAKIAEPGIGPSGNVRNATAGEITAFASAEASDESVLDATHAANFADIDPLFRKIFKALLKQLIQEIFETTNVKTNEMINQWEQHKADIAAASNLGALKTATAALPTVASDLKETVTLAQAVTALKSDILPND